jgi:hypothetical protein
VKRGDAQRNRIRRVRKHVDEILDLSVAMRQIFFFVVFWGIHFRCYFANVLLRSLLAPGNLPVLARSDGHKLLICCPEDDWLAVRAHPAFAAATHYVEFVHIPLEPPPHGRHPVDHMSVGHRRAVETCFEAKVYGSLLHPDMLFADGFVASLCRHVVAGTQALLVPALRLAQSRLFTNLGLDADRDAGDALVFSPRAIAAASIESLHDEIVECEIEGPRFSLLPNSVWWRASQGGVLVHSFSWSPVLMDYSAVTQHVIEGLGGPLADGDYVARNMHPDARITFVADSDDIVFASWTPDAVGARDGGRSILQNMPVFGRALRRAILRRAYRYYTHDLYPYGDHVKAKGFHVPLKFHARDLDRSWDAVEAAAGREIAASVGDLLDPPVCPPNWRTRFLDWITLALPAYESVQRASASLRLIRRRAIAALRGDPHARAWIFDRLRARLGIRF